MPAAPRKHLLQLPQMHSSVQPQGMASAALLRVGGTASLVENTRTPRTFMMYLDDPCRQKKVRTFRLLTTFGSRQKECFARCVLLYVYTT